MYYAPKVYGTGLLCGKFYPPHLGHQYLINTALSLCDRVVLLLVYTPGQEPDARQREEWLHELFPEETGWNYYDDKPQDTLVIITVVDLETNDDDPASSIAWAEYTNDILQSWEFVDVDEEDDDPWRPALGRPEVVFSSEEYGSRWATELNMKHVLVDRSRTAYPISGTMVRANPLENWQYLPPPVKEYYALRVAIVGPESTGKTTLAKNLAEHFNTLWVPEYGRLYVEQKGSVENTNQKIIFPMILTEQPKMENELARQCNKLLICDTELITTQIWYDLWQPDHGDDAIARALQEKVYEMDYDLILLSMPDSVATWVDDGIRDQGHTREWFTEQLFKRFEAQNYPITLLSGSWERRLLDAKLDINVRLLDNPELAYQKRKERREAKKGVFV